MENTSTYDTGSANPRPAEQATREYLSFQLGSVEYGIDILKVQEIRGFETSTRMFNAPALCSGRTQYARHHRADSGHAPEV